MSKAFDTVDRVRIRKALDQASADPALIEVVGKLHVNSLCEMTGSDSSFQIARLQIGTGFLGFCYWYSVQAPVISQ